MSVQQLSTDKFEKIIKDKKINLLDVREKYEFEAGHIKGARLVPATNFNKYFEKLKIKKSDKIALYSRIGNRSDFISKKLDNLGFRNVYNLELGLLDWIDQGRKLRTKKGQNPKKQSN